ncbi:phosphotransferase [Streptomyces sp. WSLK1-5]|uniref:phosphotransferase n=1 Tax=Streptomyces sp. WSLK1-5 TaxID=3375473 RepID=UPI00379F0D52
MRRQHGAANRPGDAAPARPVHAASAAAGHDHGLRKQEQGSPICCTSCTRLLHRLHSVPARVSADPANRILHLDLHPDNVMLTSGTPVVIDWRNTEEGPPGLDWGMSALILAQVAVGNTP